MADRGQEGEKRNREQHDSMHVASSEGSGLNQAERSREGSPRKRPTRRRTRAPNASRFHRMHTLPLLKTDRPIR
jgi:hypothetical protein